VCEAYKLMVVDEWRCKDEMSFHITPHPPSKIPVCWTSSSKTYPSRAKIMQILPVKGHERAGIRSFGLSNLSKGASNLSKPLDRFIS
jgi:hypothetical protein